MGALCWLPALAMLAGCHLGGGPVVAVGRGGRVTVQGQAVGGVAALRADMAIDLFDSEALRGGSVALGGWTFPREPEPRGIGASGSIGAAGTDAGTRPFFATAPFVEFAPEEADACDHSFTMATVSLGIRLRGPALEVFLAPHLHRVFAGCGPSS